MSETKGRLWERECYAMGWSKQDAEKAARHKRIKSTSRGQALLGLESGQRRMRDR